MLKFKTIFTLVLISFINIVHSQETKPTLKDFLLSAYNPPYAWRPAPYEDSVFIDYKNANFNNFLWVRDDDELVQKVRKYGFNYYLSIDQSIGGEDDDIEYLLRGSNDEAPPEITEELLQQLDEAIDKYKSDPNLTGYYICDEPYANAFDNIAKVVARIKEKDPSRLCFVNLWPYFENEEGDNTPEEGDDNYLESFIQKTNIQLLSYDRYNFYNQSDDNEEYFKQIARIREKAIKYNIPFCNIVQAVGTNGTSVSWDSPGDGEHLDWRTPNEAEHRWLVYSSLVYGVHGIVWFHWDCCDWGVIENPDRDIIYPSLQSINGEIDSLKDIMFHLTTTNVYHTIDDPTGETNDTINIYLKQSDSTDLVVGAFKDEYDKENYFMLMNKNYEDSILTDMHINHILDSLLYFDVTINKWQDVPFENDTAGANFIVHLRKGGGKLFKFTEKKATKIVNVNFATADLKLNNSPNPFGASTIIKYSVPASSTGNTVYYNVKLNVFDINGNKIKTIVDKKQITGDYQIKYSGDKLPKGVYFLEFKIHDKAVTKRMILY